MHDLKTSPGHFSCLNLITAFLPWEHELKLSLRVFPNEGNKDAEPDSP